MGGGNRRTKGKGKSITTSSSGVEIGGSKGGAVEDGVSKVKIGDALSDPMDFIRSQLMKYDNERRGTSKVKHDVDARNDFLTLNYNYEVAATFRNKNRKDNEFSRDWMVKRLSIDMLSFSEEEMGKSLYSCFCPFGPGGLVIRSVEFRELVSNSSLKFNQILKYESAEEDLGLFTCYPVHCAVHRSRIFCWGFCWEPSGDVSQLPDIPYRSPYPLMVELGGKLHALSFDENQYSFHVLDSDKKGWLELPQPPYLGYCERDCSTGPLICPAVVCSKLLLFVQARFKEDFSGRPYQETLERRVFCFDPAASKGREWRQVSAPSFRFHLPPSMSSQTRALVLNESNMNIMFLFDQATFRIGVHILELDDDDIKLIGYFNLPESFEFTLPGRAEFVHIGARKVCLVGAKVQVPFRRDPCLVAIPFDFTIHISKKKVKFFTLRFMPPRISESYPSHYIDTGSFLL